MGAYIGGIGSVALKRGEIMKKLPEVRIIRSSAHHRQMLADWLNEWRIDRALRQDEAEISLMAKRSVLLYETGAVREGQIRLFHPFTDVTAANLRYLAVLRKGDKGGWLTAPFSRFDTPAVPGELKTGRNVHALRTLCVWNARALPLATLVRSWIVDRLTPRQVAHALAIHAFLAEGKVLSASLLRRTGPPLVHPLDPRFEYLDEERAWFSAMSTIQALDKPSDASGRAFDGTRQTLPLAAEERAEYGTSRTRPGKHRPGGKNPRKSK